MAKSKKKPIKKDFEDYQVGEWVSTSITPPKDFEYVYVQMVWGDHDIQKYIPPRIKPKDYPDGYWGDTDYVECDFFEVQAWSKLPEPYREETEW